MPKSVSIWLFSMRGLTKSRSDNIAVPPWGDDSTRGQVNGAENVLGRNLILWVNSSRRWTGWTAWLLDCPFCRSSSLNSKPALIHSIRKHPWGQPGGGWALDSLRSTKQVQSLPSWSKEGCVTSGKFANLSVLLLPVSKGDRESIHSRRLLRGVTRALMVLGVFSTRPRCFWKFSW